jgi:hypothetical protein
MTTLQLPALQRFGVAGKPWRKILLHPMKQKAAGRMLLRFGLLMLASLLTGCVHDRKEAKHHNLEPYLQFDLR